MASNVQIIPIHPRSDGDKSHRPKPEWRIVEPPTIYLEKLAHQWLAYRGEPTRPGVKYYLDRLPEGYALFERPRPANNKLVDRHLYGHPGHKFFDSPNRFWPHFLNLMEKGNNLGCPCTICGSKGSVPIAIREGKSNTKPALAGNPAGNPTGRLPGRPPGRPAKAKPGRPPAKPDNTGSIPYAMTEEDQIPDMLRHKIDKMKAFGTLDEEFNEPMSMDWRSEWRLQESMFETLMKQPSFSPRIGELVLFVRSLDGEQISRDEKTNQYKIYDLERRGFLGPPTWEAGVITQIPQEHLQLRDILTETRKEQNVTYSGFRVEPLPDPNDKNKSWSKKFQYVPFHHIRPLVFWKEFLNGIPENEWHVTIKHALKIMASISVTGKFHCKGNWPDLTILCRGMYLGAELITLEDVVRILPVGAGSDNLDDSHTITDVLHIKSVKCKLTNLDKASVDDRDEGHPYNTTVVVSGKAYTTSPSRAWNGQPITHEDARSSKIPSGMNGYEGWYYLHDPAKYYQTSFRNILGRCYESESMRLWFPPAADEKATRSSLSKGLYGLVEARQFSGAADKRIHESKSFYVADSRGETLDLHEFNSIPLSSHDAERTDSKLESWADSARILEQVAGNKHKVHLKQLAGTSGSSGGLAGAGAMAPPNARIAATDGETEEDEEQNNHDRAKLAQKFGIIQTSSLMGMNSPLGKRSRSVANDEDIYTSDSVGSSGTSGNDSGEGHGHDAIMGSADEVKDVAMTDSGSSEPAAKVDKGKARAPEIGESSESSSVNLGGGAEVTGEKIRKKKLGGWFGGLGFAGGGGD